MNNISLSIITTSLMLIFSMNTLYSQGVYRVIDNISVEDNDTLIIAPAIPFLPLDPEVPLEPLDPEVPLEPLKTLDPEVPLDSLKTLDPEVPLDSLEPEVPLEPLEPEVPLEPLEPRTKFLFDGYTVGLNVSYPLINGWYFTDQIGPSVGIVVSTPYGFDLGSFSVGVGAGVEILNVGAENDDFTYNYTGFYLSLESAVYETPAGPISVSGAGGWYGSLVYSGAIMFDYAVPGKSMVIQPYVREIIFTEVDDGNPSYLISIGATIHYDISTLF